MLTRKPVRISLPYSILEYDIETAPLQANIWGLGEQTVRHGQLVKRQSNYIILTISYMWYGENKIRSLDFRDPKMLQKFDALIRKADVTLGKNSDRFDVKHINTQRMLAGLTPLPEWTQTTEDLEKQLRKYFVFPSQSLDYISNLMGLGGKEKMEFSDWTDIMDYHLLQELFVCPKYESICPILFHKTAKQVDKDGRIALKKMIHYNQKDVLDMDAILQRVLPYIQLKQNGSSTTGNGCVTCGSTQLMPTKNIKKGKTMYQLFNCLAHGGYGGKATYKYDKNRHKRYGKMGA